MAAESWDGLTVLLKVNSKDAVQKVIQEAFRHRNGAVPDVVLAAVAKTLSIEPLEARELFSSACLLVSSVLQSGALEEGTISNLFPDDFHHELKGLLSEITAGKVLEWRDRVLTEQVSLPRLESFDWRVDVKTSSTCVARMAIPTCLLQMKVQGGRGVPEAVTVEFSAETLDTMLDGLSKIRNQLASVATK